MYIYIRGLELGGGGGGGGGGVLRVPTNFQPKLSLAILWSNNETYVYVFVISDTSETSYIDIS